jgi:MscS family membrane protein
MAVREWMHQLPFFTELSVFWLSLEEEFRGTVLIFCLLAATAAVAFIVSRLFHYLRIKVTQTPKLWDDVLFQALRKPAAAFVWLEGIFWAAEVAYRYSGAEIFTYNNIVLHIGILWLIAWTAIRFVREFEEIAVSNRVKRPMDLTTVSALGKLARAVIILTVALIVMQTLGYSISGVLAFGGIGGIAVGFAAKDLLANFFGGAMVYMDRPFKVGDWIRSPDRDIQGTVERIGWRLTTIRTFDQRPLYVPNSIFTSISVENPSRMLNRRIYQVIGIRYADISVMGSITDEVREMLENHEEVDADQIIMANFEKFGPSSLDFFVYCYLKTTNWAKYHAVLQEVLLRISEIIMAHGAKVALPASTLHFAESVDVRHLSGERKESDRAQQQAPDDNAEASPDKGLARESGEALDKGKREQRDVSEAELARERHRKAENKGPLADEDQDQAHNAGSRQR